jgi:deoxyribonuclease-4
MPLLGAHMSIAGGLHLAFERIRKVRGEALQVFTKNQVQWRSPLLGTEAVERFKEAWGSVGPMPVAAHAGYLINLAIAGRERAEQAVHAFAEELQRAALLGIPFLITHPGAHLGEGATRAVRRVARNLDRALARSRASQVTVLLETTAGQGSGVGSTFEEIAAIIERSRYSHRLGVCFDTCHAFAAGYEIHTPFGYAETFARFDRIIGLERLRFFHLNDSKKGLGCRIDRHEHIGKGEIGVHGFRLLLNDPRFQHHPMVLETPKGKDLKEDKRNLKVLRSLMEGP